MKPRLPVTLAVDTAKSLRRRCSVLPRIDTQTQDIDSNFTPLAADIIRQSSDVLAFCTDISKALKMEGHVVVDFAALSNEVDLLRERTEITAVLAFLGTPMRIFDAWPLWKPIETKPEIDPWRAGGTGLIPLHMDFVNCEFPPEYSCLFCLVEDPGGGGDNTVSNVHIAYDSINAKDKAILEEYPFSEGAVVNLSNVGRDINPFRVVNENSPWKIRFTAKAIFRLEASPFKDALQSLEKALVSNSTMLALQRFQIWIVDQRMVVHGRMPLVGDQVLLPQSQRRLLHQFFIRSNG